jgi:hypothetical protein
MQRLIRVENKLNLMALITDDLAAGAETSARFLTRAPRTPASSNFRRKSTSWGQCSDNYFWRFGPLFGEKMAVVLHKLALF